MYSHFVSVQVYLVSEVGLPVQVNGGGPSRKAKLPASLVYKSSCEYFSRPLLSQQAYILPSFRSSHMINVHSASSQQHAFRLIALY